MWVLWNFQEHLFVKKYEQLLYKEQWATHNNVKLSEAVTWYWLWVWKQLFRSLTFLEVNPCWSLFLYSWNIRLEISEISCLEKYPWLSLFSEVESLGLKLISILTPLQIFSWKCPKIHRVAISQKNLMMKNSTDFLTHQHPNRYLLDLVVSGLANV